MRRGNGHRYLLLASLMGCAPSARYLAPADTAPSGQAPNARDRLLATHADGSSEYALILKDGDEIASALLAFAKSKNVVAAHFTGLGAVRDPQVAWFDTARKQYRVIELDEQLELVSLVGDVGLDGQSTEPIVHAHVALAEANGHMLGGHLIRATASPNAEMFITTYPQPLAKLPDRTYDAKFFELDASLPHGTGTTP